MPYESIIGSKVRLEAPKPTLLGNLKFFLQADQQYRLVRFQLHNWGTFSNYHDMPVSTDGYLITGPSGSGKTTLLDGYSTMFMPARSLEYNMAARDTGRRDRNLMSYIRGAWAAVRTAEQYEITTQYLRPKSTWSALALTFKKGQNDFVTLVQLFLVKSSGTTKLSRHYFVLKREFSLQELKFTENNFDLKELKSKIFFDLETRIFEEYRSYYGEILGITSDNALKLLQKTQSMKNIEDLNSFLRNFMLDEPRTFEAAAQMVDEFTHLKAAHEAVDEAKRQIEVLAPIKPNWEEHCLAGTELGNIEELLSALDYYADERKAEFIKIKLAQLESDVANLREQNKNYSAQIKNKNATLNDLRAQFSESGGQLLEQYITQHKEDLRQLGIIRSSLTKVQEAAQFLGFDMATDQAGFENLKKMSVNELAGLADRRKNSRQEYRRLIGLEYQKKIEVKETEREIAALNEQEGNIPADAWELRKAIIKELGLDKNSLPFVGQMITVKPEQSRWEGALERALAPISCSLLVDEELYPLITQYLNNFILGKKLSFLKVSRPTSAFSGQKQFSDGSLLSKLDFKSSSYADFLILELGRRLNLVCVENLDDFRQKLSALTAEGQVKLDSEHHQKDDRYELTDQRSFCLGSDPSRKLAAFTKIKEIQQAELGDLKKKISDNAARDKEIEKREAKCRLIIDLSWEQIDVVSLEDSIATLEERITRLKDKNVKYSDLKGQINNLESEITILQKNAISCEHRIIASMEESHELTGELANIHSRKNLIILDSQTKEKLSNIFISFPQLDLKNINDIVRKVEKQLDNSKSSWISRQASAEAHLLTSFKKFMTTWPGDSLDLEAKLSYTAEYIDKFERLEHDGLPELAKEFERLLRKHTQDNAAKLAGFMVEYRKLIYNRLAIVNESLSGIPFNQVDGKPTFLNLQLIDRQLDEVNKFREDLKKIVSQKNSQDPVIMEERFLAIKKLVADLSNQDRDKVAWRDLVLDGRRHVEFFGREFDQDRNEIETYRSGAGKSGGQRQKLAATCLAAALRYQLGGRAYGYPKFGTVVFDEAFDKIDNELTVIALEIFKNLGFQMILATPMKNIPASEPYIGGAVYVSITERNRSSLTTIIYDSDQKKLIWPKASLLQPPTESSDTP
jgi:uncharacterized protein YPO0396